MSTDRNDRIGNAEGVPAGKAGRWGPRATAGMIVGVCAALIALTWMTANELVEFERRGAIEYTTTQNSNLAKAFEEHAIRTLTGVDQTLLYVKRAYERHRPGLDLHRMAQDREVDSSIFTFLGIVDEHGRLIAGIKDFPPTQLADRDYFEVHRNRDPGGMFVGQPVIGRVTGRWAFQASRRIDKPDGSFGGIVYAAIDPGYFTSFYEKVDLGRDGFVLLAGADGIVRARRISGRTDFGADLRSNTVYEQQAGSEAGNFLSLGRNGGVPRFVSYRRLPQYPMFIAVGTAEREALAGFFVRQRQYWVGATLIALLFALIGAGALLSRRRDRAARAALEASQVRYRATFNHAALGIAIFNPDGTFQRANPKLCEMLGFTEDELIGREFSDFNYPEDRVRSIRALLLASPENTITDVERRYVRRDGEVIWGSVNAVSIRKPDGTPDYQVALIQDITARKKAQQRLNAIFYQAAVGIVHSTPDMELLEANPKFCAMIGYTEEEMRGRSSREFTHPDDIPRAIELRRRLLEHQPGYLLQSEKRYLRKDGAVIWAHLTATTVRDAEGNPDYVLTMITDISERKRAEEALRRSEQELRQVLHEREQLSRDLHDDIVQSIYAVGLGLEEAKRMLPPAAAPAGVRLTTEIAHLNQVIRKVRRHITRGLAHDGERGRIHAELQSIAESASAVHKMHFLLDAAPDVLDGLPSQQADEVLNIVREAVSNSLRHSGGHRGIISVAAVDGGARLEITDDGEGFDPDNASEGHGLRNMAARARELGGALEIRSVPGRGTRVILNLMQLEEQHA